MTFSASTSSATSASGSGVFIDAGGSSASAGLAATRSAAAPAHPAAAAGRPSFIPVATICTPAGEYLQVSLILHGDLNLDDCPVGREGMIAGAMKLFDIHMRQTTSASTGRPPQFFPTLLTADGAWRFGAPTGPAALPVLSSSSGASSSSQPPSTLGGWTKIPSLPPAAGAAAGASARPAQGTATRAASEEQAQTAKIWRDISRSFSIAELEKDVATIDSLPEFNGLEVDTLLASGALTPAQNSILQELKDRCLHEGLLLATLPNYLQAAIDQSNKIIDAHHIIKMLKDHPRLPDDQLNHLLSTREKTLFAWFREQHTTTHSQASLKKFIEGWVGANYSV